MEDYEPQVKVAWESKAFHFLADCGCASVEYVQYADNGEILSRRLEDERCGLGQAIFEMIQRAVMLSALFKVKEDRTAREKWATLFYQRIAMEQAHLAANGYGKGGE